MKKKVISSAGREKVLSGLHVEESPISTSRAGFTEFSCFVYLWDSRDCMKHYKQTQWLNRNALNRGSHKVIREPLIERSKILLPPLHIKLGLIKNSRKLWTNKGNVSCIYVSSLKNSVMPRYKKVFSIVLKSVKCLKIKTLYIT